MANVFSKLTKRTFDFIGNRAKSVYDSLNGLFAGRTSLNIDESNVLSVTPAWRAINILKDIIATTPVGFYEIVDGDLVLRETHPCHKLVSSNPHPLSTPYLFFTTLVVNACVYGNAIARIYRNNSGTPVALEAIEYCLVQNTLLVTDSGGVHLEYLIKNADGKEYKLHSDDVIHIKGLSLNTLLGVNTTRTHADTLATGIALRNFVKSFLEKGAFVSGILSAPHILSEPAYKKLKSSWDSAHGGVEKAGGTAIVDGGIKFEKIQSNISEIGYELIKGASAVDVSNIYGVPLYLIDGTVKPTYNAAEQMTLDFVKYTINGWFANIEQELTKKLVSGKNIGRQVFAFDRMSLANGDIKTMGELYQKLYNMSVMNPNEIRHKLKLNKVEHGDRYMVQGNNMIPVDAIDKMLSLRQSNPTANGDKNVGADMNTIKE